MYMYMDKNMECYGEIAGYIVVFYSLLARLTVGSVVYEPLKTLGMSVTSSCT